LGRDTKEMKLVIDTRRLDRKEKEKLEDDPRKVLSNYL